MFEARWPTYATSISVGVVDANDIWTAQMMELTHQSLFASEQVAHGFPGMRDGAWFDWLLKGPQAPNGFYRLQRSLRLT